MYEPRHAVPRRPYPVLPAAVTVACLGVTALALAETPPASAVDRAPLLYLDRGTSSYVKEFLGDPYVYGGTSPAGFDCSGLAQHVYAAFGYDIPRTADEQFQFFRPISEDDAWGGDLVFFHDSGGYVYHVGIYEGDGHMVSALDSEYGVKWTPVDWGGTYYTFGTLSH